MNANILEGPFDAVPHIFLNKQLIAVTISNAFMDATKEAVPFTYCEVFGPREEMSNVCLSNHAALTFLFSIDVMCIAVAHLFVRWLGRPLAI